MASMPPPPPTNDPNIVDPHDPFCVNRVGTANLRDLDALDQIGGPFDITTHTVDVRPICQCAGWYNIKKVGFFFWRLSFLSFCNAAKSIHYADGFHFSPLGNPAPLFTQPPLIIPGYEPDRGIAGRPARFVRPLSIFIPADTTAPLRARASASTMEQIR